MARPVPVLHGMLGRLHLTHQRRRQWTAGVAILAICVAGVGCGVVDPPPKREHNNGAIHGEPTRQFFPILRLPPDGLPASVKSALGSPRSGMLWPLARQLRLDSPNRGWGGTASHYFCLVGHTS